jgi:hypothetical protein
MTATLAAGAVVMGLLVAAVAGLFSSNTLQRDQGLILVGVFVVGNLVWCCLAPRCQACWVLH